MNIDLSPPVNIVQTDPKAVVQRLLELSGAALIDGDFEAFEQCIALPQIIETPSGRRTLHNRQDLKDAFDKNHRYLRESSVTDIARHCIDAAYRPDGTIVSSHQTRMVNGTVLTQNPYPCLLELKRVDDTWKVSVSVHQILDNPRLSQMLGQD